MKKVRKAWKCRICGKEFEYYRDVMEHLHKEHPGAWLEKPYTSVVFQGITDGGEG